MTWTSSEVRYLEEHAGDGAAAIAEAVRKLEQQAQDAASTTSGSKCDEAVES